MTLVLVERYAVTNGFVDLHQEVGLAVLEHDSPLITAGITISKPDGDRALFLIMLGNCLIL